LNASKIEPMDYGRYVKICAIDAMVCVISLGSYEFFNMELISIATILLLLFRK